MSADAATPQRTESDSPPDDLRPDNVQSSTPSKGEKEQDHGELSYGDAEYDGAEYDGAEYDGAEYDGAEYDGAEYDGAEFGDAEYEDAEYADDAGVYRSVSIGAVASVVLAVIAQPLIWLMVGDETIFYVLLALPLIGAFVGFVSLLKIRRYPHELMGKPLALIGGVVCTLTLLAAVGAQSYILMTEVPDGYERISWYELRPHDANEKLPIPVDVVSLDGKKVFIKGYVHPSVSGTGPVKQCMLVGDMGTCCFGGQPKLVERIDAVFENDLKITYSTRLRKLGGTFRLNVNRHDPRTFFKPDDGTEGPYYILQVDYLK